jgi:three-Cys-motif partner protein
VTASSKFFGQRNAQAVLKHGVLTRYAHYFAGRAGSATAGKVAFIDGYAGAGRYEDGSPGSPLLLASQADRATMLGRDVKLALVEPDDARRTQLGASLSHHGVNADQLLGSTFQEVAGGLLDRYERHAVLLFVDPFGLAIARDTLEQILRRSNRSQPIDVLYHFSLSSVARMGRSGVMDVQGSQQSSEQLDVALGSLDWRSRFMWATGPGAPTEAALEVAYEFGASVAASAGVRATGIPVRQHPDHLPQYLLILLSRDDRAHWDYADQAGKAHVDWLHHCDEQEYRAFIKADEEHGVMSLFDAEPPDLAKLDTHLTTEAVPQLREQIARLLREQGPLRPVDHIEGGYGSMLGRARITHYRSALKQLHSEGLVDDDAKGDFWERTVRWLGA